MNFKKTATGIVIDVFIENTSHFMKTSAIDHWNTKGIATTKNLRVIRIIIHLIIYF
jgi:hypothetical protein